MDKKKSGKQILDDAFDQLEAELPPKLARLVHWLRGPQARWVRIPAALICFAFAFFWFMPVIGLEWAPVGLLLIAIDLPFLQRPVGLFILWLLEQWHRWKAWRAKRRASAG